MPHKALQTDSTQMETINQGENSMISELLTKRDPAITTHEENVRARAYELYEVRGRIDGHAEEDWLQSRRRSSRKQRTKRRPSLDLKIAMTKNRW
jgi:hypothetical protein